MSRFVLTKGKEKTVMNLDVRPLLRGEMTRMPLDFPVAPEAPFGVDFVGDAHVAGEITNQGGYMRLCATATLRYRGQCARCLSDIEGDFCMPFERTVVTEGTLTEEQLEDNVDEYVVVQNGFLDIDDSVREALILSFPMRLLCEDDCPGLCSRCGKPKRDGACGCVEKEIDPRWAVLASLRFDEEETDGNGADESQSAK